MSDVNKQLLAALKSVLPWVVTQEIACNGLKCREQVCMSCSFDSEKSAQLASNAYAVAAEAIAAAEAAQPDGQDERAEFEKWFRREVGMPDFVGFDQTAPWAEFAFKSWSARAAQQPASAQPVAVPDGYVLAPKKVSVSMACAWKDNMDAKAGIQAMWNAMLSAAQKQKSEK